MRFGNAFVAGLCLSGSFYTALAGHWPVAVGCFFASALNVALYTRRTAKP